MKKVNGKNLGEKTHTWYKQRFIRQNTLKALTIEKNIHLTSSKLKLSCLQKLSLRKYEVLLNTLGSNKINTSMYQSLTSRMYKKP